MTAWSIDPYVIGACVLTLAFYRLRYRRMSGLFVVAVAIVFLALASPIATLANGVLFSAHMLQHLLLVLIVPPLVLWSLPPATDPPSVRSASPWLWTWLAGVGAMWLWHLPSLCDLATQSLAVQRVQTVSLLGMGTAFWWPIYAPRPTQRLPAFGGIAYLFTACIACTLLGILVTFSPVQVCAIYARPAASLVREGLGLSSKADQELGGLMMWVPGCLVYAGTILGLLARYYREDDAPVDVMDAIDALEKGT